MDTQNTELSKSESFYQQNEEDQKSSKNDENNMLIRDLYIQ